MSKKLTRQNIIAFVSLPILIITGLIFTKIDSSLAENRVLMDEVIDNTSTPDISLTGYDSTKDLCLKRNQNTNIELGCHNAPAFQLLSNVGTGELAAKYGTYADKVNAAFFFQYKLGGHDSNSYFNKDEKSNPKYDAEFNISQAQKIFGGISLMSTIWSQSQRKYRLLECAAVDNSFAPKMDGLLSQNRYIAIGAYSQAINQDKYSSGAFTYSRSLDIRYHEKEIDVTVSTGRHKKQNIKFNPIYLVGLSININDLDNSSVPRTASIIFHELLHNVGLQHGGNDPNSYNDRKKPILALEDCMLKEAVILENEINSVRIESVRDKKLDPF
jgi:hypothetical protein